MSPMPTINLMQPIAAACVMDATQLPRAEDGPGSEPGVAAAWAGGGEPSPPAEELSRQLQEQQAELAQQLETVNGLVRSLTQLHEQTLVGNRVEIARLAVEIARKILMYKVEQGDYEIQAIVEEALKQAPTRQNLVVHVSAEDLPRCQQLQSENPQGALAELEFAADWNVGRGECLVETPKGVVKSFIAEHLERIGEALQKAQ
jgi:flagellar biosynthesis/type III secretory pathway protein FliH